MKRESDSRANDFYLEIYQRLRQVSYISTGLKKKNE